MDPYTAVGWGLNEEQLRPYQENGHCCTNAGPGSGKTRMLVAKICRLTKETDPGQIMAVTFTRASAKEMKERLAKAVGVAVAKRVTIGTFHGICYRQLMLVQGKKLAVIEAWKRADLIDEIRSKVAPTMDNDEGEYWVSWFQNHLDAETKSMDNTERLGFEIYTQYKKHLAQGGQVDKDELIVSCLRAYQSGAFAPNPVKRLLVDEFQDSDENQVEWVSAHLRAGAIVDVIGDDDQSIYGFRDSLGVEAFRRIQEIAEKESGRPMPLYQLQRNYRSGSEIVQAAARLVECNVERIPKTLLPMREEPGTVECLTFPSRETEADAVIAAWRERARGPVVVLSRTKHWIFALKTLCRVEEVPHQILGDSKSLADGPYIGRMLAALKIGVKGNARENYLHALRLAGLPGRSIRVIREAFKSKPKTPLSEMLYDEELMLGVPLDDRELLRETREAVMDWVEGLEACESEKDPAKKDDSVSKLIKEYMEFFVIHARKTEAVSDLTILRRIMVDRMHGSVKARVELLEKPSQGEGEKGLVDGINLMTLHGSKGMEFPWTWIVGCTDGHMPSDKAQKPEHVEEERRLFYVGMTRAQDTLTVSAVANDGSDGEKVFVPSIFLREAGVWKESTINEKGLMESREDA